MKHPECEEFGFEWVDEMYPTNEEKDETMMSECERRNCSYFWKSKNDACPRCYYDDPMSPAPCEQDDDYEPDDIDDDMGYDPYEGCFTWDC